MQKNRKGADLLVLIQQSKNVREACRELGISRSQYYKLLQNPEPAAPKVYEPLKIGMENVQKIKDLALSFPFGCHSIGYKLLEENIRLSAVSVQKILNHHHLGTAKERFQALEKKILESKNYTLNAEQKEFITKHNPALLEYSRNIKAPGELLTVFSHFLGQLPWLGKVYLYFGLDAYSGYVQSMLCYTPDKYLCADFLKETIFPFYEKQGVPIQQVETSDDPEFFSYAYHPFSSFLRNLKEIKYQRTTVGGGKTNGFSQKWVQYLQAQIVPALKRNKNKYLDLESLQEDLQNMLKVYNEGKSPEARAHFEAYPFAQRIPLAAFKTIS